MTAMIGQWETNQIYNVDALTLLAGLPDASVNCIVTSPPYFGLRDYGVDGQLGLEETPDAYVAALVTVFREARRVLRDDGTFWLNLGDSYAQDKKWGGKTGGKHAKGLHGSTGIGRYRHKTGLPGKNLIGIPWRVAFALQADGWILREDIIWSKPNAMPESVTDRPTRSHEYLFLLTKCGDYWYDADAIKEPAVDGDTRYPKGSAAVMTEPNAGLRHKQDAVGKRTYTGFNDRWKRRLTGGQFSNSYADQQMAHGGQSERKPYTTRNKRSVWTISTKAYAGAHFAVMPEALVEPCILAGCPEGGVTLDMFMGSGTVARVARRLGRQFIGCDINADYVKLARESLRLPFEAHHVEQMNDMAGLPLFSPAVPS